MYCQSVGSLQLQLEHARLTLRSFSCFYTRLYVEEVDAWKEVCRVALERGFMFDARYPQGLGEGRRALRLAARMMAGYLNETVWGSRRWSDKGLAVVD